MISGNYWYGIYLSGSGTTGTIITGNKIGTDITGTLALPNVYGISMLTSTSDTTIGGTAAGAGNLISGNKDAGIEAFHSPDNVVQGNRIGTDSAGTVAVPNGDGLAILYSSGNMIGGSVSGEANLISGNGGDGVYLYGAGKTGTIVAGNQIGTDITGTRALPNGVGVDINNASGTTVGGTVTGDSNLISGNNAGGIYLHGPGTTGTVVAGNKIGTDITGTVALSDGRVGVFIYYGATYNTIGGLASTPGTGAGISSRAITTTVWKLATPGT